MIEETKQEIIKEETQKQEQKTPKLSIFVCKECKANTIEIEKKPKVEKVKSEIVQVKLEPAKYQKDAKFCVKIDGKTIHFGRKGENDLTIHKKEIGKDHYISQHKKRDEQYWTAEQENLKTSAFWNRFALNEDVDLFEALKKIETTMGCEIKFTKATIEKQQRKLARHAKIIEGIVTF